MRSISQRQIAKELGLSVASVSRALHDAPGVSAATSRRVKQALKKHGYELDPLLSSGLSKVRRGEVHYQTIAWCSDIDHAEMPLLGDLYASAESFASKIGYKIEHFHFGGSYANKLDRLSSVWVARGIRGVLLGPMHKQHRELPFPWDSPELAWVCIGDTFRHPDLHCVRRDTRADLEFGIRWLLEKGAKRPCLLLEPERYYLFEDDFLDAALRFHHEQGNPGKEPPYFEITPGRSVALESWLKRHRPDGLILPGRLSDPVERQLSRLGSLPRVRLSPDPARAPLENQLDFTAHYEALGSVAVSTLNRLIRNQVTGIPEARQSVLINSVHSSYSS